jgi:hypothetical protein
LRADHQRNMLRVSVRAAEGTISILARRTGKRAR